MKRVARSLAGRLRRLALSGPTRIAHPIETEALFEREQTRRLLHEVHVHQAELEAQNEELRKTRASLEATAARYTELYDFAPLGYFTLKASGIISEMNLHGAQLLGGQRSALRGVPFAAFVSRADQQTFRTFLQDAFSVATGAVCELRMREQGNQERILRLEAARINNEAACQVVAVDVTERTRREEELTRERERSAIAQRMASAGIWDCDLPSRRIDGSAEFFRLFGMDPSCAPHGLADWRSRLHPEDAPRVDQDCIKAIRSRKPFSSEYRIILADDSVRWIASYGDTTYDERRKPLRLTGICLDITARKEAEIERERYKRFFDSASDLMSITNREGQRLEVNAAFCRTLGYSREELLSVDSDANVHPQDLDFQRAELSKLGADVPSVDFVTRYVCQNGAHRWISWHTVFGSEDNAAYNVGRDITEKRAADDALRGAKDTAEAANRAKTAFLAAASHDLRQPLAALEMYVATLKQQAPASNMSIVANMEGCIDSLSALLVDLLDLSKLEARVVVPEIADFPLQSTFSALLSTHGPSADIKGLRLRCAPSDRIARTDAVLFQRVLGNLIANAIRYTERGGVLIACRRRRGKDWVEVWDTGIGIPSDKISEIFEEFRQLGDGARNRGSGLGLAIVAKTADLLGLEIRVRSTPGRGSCFAIELPAGRASSPSRPQLAPVRVHSLRIALVEDHEQLRLALAMTLGADGHEVLAAGSGAELERTVVAFNPDVILSDYRLPGRETGFNVIAASRHALGWDVPAMVLTGDTDPDVVRSMAEQGILVLHKPVAPEILRAHLQQLAGSSARDPRTPR